MNISNADFKKKVRALAVRRTKMEKRLLDAVSNYYDMQIMSVPSNILYKPLYMLDAKDLEILKRGHVDAKALKEAENAKLLKPPTGESRAADILKTPANTSKTPMSAMITPKFNPQATMSVLRKPKEGEVAISMCGSPLHVSSVINESKPNIVVPLESGKILSVLPEKGLRRSEIPNIHPDLRRQLKVLKENLNTILGYDE